MIAARVVIATLLCCLASCRDAPLSPFDDTTRYACRGDWECPILTSCRGGVCTNCQEDPCAVRECGEIVDACGTHTCGRGKCNQGFSCSASYKCVPYCDVKPCFAEVASPATWQLTTLWGSPDAGVFAFGQGESALHWNGSQWSESPLSDGGLSHVAGAWGFSSDRVFALTDSGEFLSWDGTAWTEQIDMQGSYVALWGTAPDRLWAFGNVGSLSEIRRFDGTTWRSEDGGVTDIKFRAAHGTADDDIWVVGDKGLIVHFDGTRWQQHDPGGREDLNGVWAVDRSTAFAVGDSTVVLRWDGAQWSRWPREEVNYSGSLTGVWASSRSDVWALSSSYVMHFDGATWDAVPRGTTTAHGILGVGEHDVWVVGSLGKIERYIR